MSDTPLRPVRWKFGLFLLVLTPLAVLFAWWVTGRVADGDRTIQMTATLTTLSFLILAQAIWWIFLARLRRRGKIAGVICLAVISGLVAASVRIDGYRGELLPILAFRWEPTPEERAVAFFQEGKATSDRPRTASPLTVRPGDWPEFRGVERLGVVADAHIRTDWQTEPPQVIWKHPCGLGWSSFALVDGHLFTQEQRGEEEMVVCYDASSGKQIWAHADVARFSEALGGDGPRATPTFAEGRVYALGATGLLNCLEASTGELIWRRDILEDAGEGQRIDNISWGMAGSPEVWEGKVFVVPGGGDQQREVIAYDAESGEIVWSAGGEGASYAAPRVEVIGGVPQLLVVDRKELKAFDPETGDQLWAYGPWKNSASVNASQPIVQGDQVFLSSGYGVGSVLLNVSSSSDGWMVEEAWRNNNEFKLKFNDAVLHDGYLYGLDEGILACYELSSGKRQWKRGRYGYGQLILLGEHLVLLAEDGTLALIPANPERYEEWARIPVLEGKTWNHPIFSNGLLYVRNDREVACLDLRPQAEDATITEANSAGEKGAKEPASRQKNP